MQGARLVSVKMELKNDRALELALKSLGPKLETRVMARALKAGAGETLKAAKRLAPRGKTGNLRKSLAVSRGRRVRRYGRRLVAVVGPAWPEGAHGHLIERGTRRRRTKTGADRGIMPARPFLEPAYDATKTAAVAKVKQKIRQGIEREVAKMRAKK